MTNQQQGWPYWSVDLPGLTEANARRLISWATNDGIALGGIAVDPADAFSVHMDRDTVVALLTSLAVALRSSELPAEQLVVARGFADQLRNWMATLSEG